VDDKVKQMQRQRDNQLLRFGKIDKGVRWDLPIVGCFQRISTSTPRILSSCIPADRPHKTGRA
jgi:hypothetical protein